MQLHRMYPRHYSTTGVCVCQSVLAVLAAVEAIVVMKVMAIMNASQVHLQTLDVNLELTISLDVLLINA